MQYAIIETNIGQGAGAVALPMAYELAQIVADKINGMIHEDDSVFK